MVGKIRNFQPISRRISETVQDMTKVIMMDYNKKSHGAFDWHQGRWPWV